MDIDTHDGSNPLHTLPDRCQQSKLFRYRQTSIRHHNRQFSLVNNPLIQSRYPCDLHPICQLFYLQFRNKEFASMERFLALDIGSPLPRSPVLSFIGSKDTHGHPKSVHHLGGNRFSLRNAVFLSAIKEST
jgi:hypothetical protein